MIPSPHRAIPAPRWESSFFAFVREELAPTPARWRATLRLTTIALLGIALTQFLHLPGGQYLVIFLFAVNMPDAWPSLSKAGIRGLGTLSGGFFVIFTILAFADQPWWIFLTQAGVIAATLFFSRTTTVPYAVILSGFTFVLLLPNLAGSPTTSLDSAVWLVVVITLGAVLGTLAQLYLWPDNPEQLLLGQLARRLRTSAEILDRVLQAPHGPPPTELTPTVATQLATQLDLLASAEARSPWLRQRHPEQARLITTLERLLLDSRSLEKVVWDSGQPLTAEQQRELQQIRNECLSRAEALEREETPAEVPVPPPFSTDLGSDPVPTLLRRLRQILQIMDACLGFLRLGRQESTSWKDGLEPLREPLSPRLIFTPACHLQNYEAIRYALKGTLAGMICYLIYHALNWPGISTSVAVCILVAQSSVGAGYTRALLIFGGALLGGLAALLMIVILMPNLFGLASFLAVTLVVVFAAAWISTGTGRTAYMGVQMVMAFSLVVLATPGKALELSPAGDRIIGVLLGVAVMSMIDLALWPSFAGNGLRRKLVETLQSLAQLARVSSTSNWMNARSAAFQVHRNVAAALNLYSEWQLEFGQSARRTESERERLLDLTYRLEDLFLALLAVMRQRKILPVDSRSGPESAPDADRLIARTLESLATSLSQGTSGPNPLRLAYQLPEPLPAESAVAYRELLRFYQNLERAVNDVQVHALTAFATSPVEVTDASLQLKTS